MFKILIIILCCFVSSAFALIKETGSDGVAVQLDKPAHRVISLAPNITETLFYIGAGKYVAGVGANSDYPDAAKKLPVVGGVRSVDIESVLKLKPDLVVAWQDGTSIAAIDKMRDMGLPVLVVNPKSLLEVIIMARHLGELTGTTAKARSRALVLAKLYREMLMKHATQKKTPVLIQIGFPPLYVAGKNSIQSEIVRLCSGRNIYADIKQAAAPVSLTSVIKRNPAAIIALSPANFIMYQHFPNLAAVKNKALFQINADEFSRAGPRIFKAAEQVCHDLDSIRR